MSVKVAIVAGTGGALGHATAATLAAGDRTVVAARRNEQALRDLPGTVRAEAAATHPPRASHARDPGERGRPQALGTPANRATFPAEVMTRAVAPQAIAAVDRFLVSDAAAPVSGAILLMSPIWKLSTVWRGRRTISATPGS